MDKKVIGNLRREEPGGVKGKCALHGTAGAIVVHDRQAHFERTETAVVTKLLREILLGIDRDGTAKIPTVVQRIAERDDDLLSRGIDRIQDETDAAAVPARITQPGCTKPD